MPRGARLTDTFLYHQPNFTVAQSDVADTNVPYDHDIRPDGKVNHRWLDLLAAKWRIKA